MKVLFVLTQPLNPTTGGVQHTTYKLGKYFTEQGLIVAYYSFAQQNHIEVEYGTLFTSQAVGSCRNPDNIKDLGKVIVTFQPDIVIDQMPYEKEIQNVIYKHQNEYGYHILSCLRNTLFAVKDNIDLYIKRAVPFRLRFLFQNAFGASVLREIHRIKHRLQLKSILKKSDFFILLAPPNNDELKYFIGDFLQDKVKAIPNSIPEIHNISFPEKENSLLYVGGLEDGQKRADLLIEVWKKIYNRLPNWTFDIVGFGPCYEKMEKIIEQEKIPRIKLWGRQKPDTYYRKAKILIMTSAYEGFPNVLIESQSYATVPVAFNSYAALSWIANDKQDALLCSPYKVDEIAQGIVDLALDDNRLEKMSKQSLINAERFVIDNVGQVWLDFFTTLRLK